MTVGGVYLGLAALFLVAAAVLWTYFNWRDWDEQRRYERLVHRNIDRIWGRR